MPRYTKEVLRTLLRRHVSNGLDNILNDFDGSIEELQAQINSIIEEGLGDIDFSRFASAEQGVLASTALQPEDLENSEILDERDAQNRNRANHTGTQQINTILGLQEALNTKEPRDQTILKEKDIGSKVQEYDEFYVRTEENFTSQEKAKLESIEEGAEKNINSDWEAEQGSAVILHKPEFVEEAPNDGNIFARQNHSWTPIDGSGSSLESITWNNIINKPEFGSAAFVPTTNFATAAQGILASTALQPQSLNNYETSAQLNNRDIQNRNRANHSGTQPISSILNLQTELNNKEPANPTILKASDINFSIQPYNVHTVIDSEYSALKTKLESIEYGAESNINADWEAEEGKAQILNKPQVISEAPLDNKQYVRKDGDWAPITIIAGEGGEIATNPGWEDILNKPNFSSVATTGDYNDLINRPSLGSASFHDVSSFATAAEGLLASTALQQNDIINFETSTQLNERDAQNRNRTNHTGTQHISTISNLEDILGTKAPLVSPIFEGNPQTPTPAISSKNNSIASTDFVHTLISLPFTRSIIEIQDNKIDGNLGNFFSKVVNNNISFEFEPVVNNKVYSLTLSVYLVNGIISWPQNVFWSEDIAPGPLNIDKTHLFVFITTNGGQSWKGISVENFSD